MQVKYTLTRPNYLIEFIDPTVPGYTEYTASLIAGGFHHEEVMSPDLLTVVSTYTLTDEEFVDYEQFLQDFKTYRDADRARRQSLGITGTTEIIN